jgi:A/G-specific adenine glycosylase
VDDFASRLLDWYSRCGRHDLPWQRTRSPYHTWLSEIMLQQTQVSTVIPYFESFIERFPDIETLANAPADDVMHHWAGLGYYSRARNLHKAAQCMAADFHGRFPESYQDALALPGVGPSTAGAILAQSMGQRHAILDGNVKRVLSRYHLVEGWPGKREVEKTLWHWAELHTPDSDLADYTQAIMDLGATVCKRSSARCNDCPVQDDCQAFRQGRVEELPQRKPQRSLPVKQKRLLIISDGARLLLEKRPPSGIWGGLWSLPELDIDEPVEARLEQNWSLLVTGREDQPVYRHTFSHFHLDITPTRLSVAVTGSVMDDGAFSWHADIAGLGLAAPVRKLLAGAV